jgi:caffeoyl-CoA O-methyltransferase
MQPFREEQMGMTRKRTSPAAVLLLSIMFVSALPCFGQGREAESVLDARVRTLLDRMKHQWHDWNVPEQDGKILYDIILRNHYKRALEVGTSTGHSAIWIAWALSKTGGKLVTIEIDEDRYKQALAHFKEAGLSDYIDARNVDAHKLVRDLPGPFDFAFIDADKDWYTNYAKAIVPKLASGGCIAAHNVDDRATAYRGGYMSGTAEYYRYMKSLPEFETRIHPGSRAGIATSYKKGIR